MSLAHREMPVEPSAAPCLEDAFAFGRVLKTLVKIELEMRARRSLSGAA